MQALFLLLAVLTEAAALDAGESHGTCDELSLLRISTRKERHLDVVNRENPDGGGGDGGEATPPAPPPDGGDAESDDGDDDDDEEGGDGDDKKEGEDEEAVGGGGGIIGISTEMDDGPPPPTPEELEKKKKDEEKAALLDGEPDQTDPVMKMAKEIEAYRELGSKDGGELPANDAATELEEEADTEKASEKKDPEKYKFQESQSDDDEKLDRDHMHRSLAAADRAKNRSKYAVSDRALIPFTYHKGEIEGLQPPPQQRKEVDRVGAAHLQELSQCAEDAYFDGDRVYSCSRCSPPQCECYMLIDVPVVPFQRKDDKVAVRCTNDDQWGCVPGFKCIQPNFEASDKLDTTVDPELLARQIDDPELGNEILQATTPLAKHVLLSNELKDSMGIPLVKDSLMKQRPREGEHPGGLFGKHSPPPGEQFDKDSGVYLPPKTDAEAQEDTDSEGAPKPTIEINHNKVERYKKLLKDYLTTPKGSGSGLYKGQEMEPDGEAPDLPKPGQPSAAGAAADIRAKYVPLKPAPAPEEEVIKAEEMKRIETLNQEGFFPNTEAGWPRKVLPAERVQKGPRQWPNGWYGYHVADTVQDRLHIKRQEAARARVFESFKPKKGGLLRDHMEGPQELPEVLPPLWPRVLVEDSRDYHELYKEWAEQRKDDKKKKMDEIKEFESRPEPAKNGPNAAEPEDREEYFLHDGHLKAYKEVMQELRNAQVERAKEGTAKSKPPPERKEESATPAVVQIKHIWDMKVSELQPPMEAAYTSRKGVNYTENLHECTNVAMRQSVQSWDACMEFCDDDIRCDMWKFDGKKNPKSCFTGPADSSMEINCINASSEYKYGGTKAKRVCCVATRRTLAMQMNVSRICYSVANAIWKVKCPLIPQWPAVKLFEEHKPDASIDGYDCESSPKCPNLEKAYDASCDAKFNALALDRGEEGREDPIMQYATNFSLQTIEDVNDLWYSEHEKPYRLVWKPIGQPARAIFTVKNVQGRSVEARDEFECFTFQLDLDHGVARVIDRAGQEAYGIGISLKSIFKLVPPAGLKFCCTAQRHFLSLTKSQNKVEVHEQCYVAVPEDAKKEWHCPDFSKYNRIGLYDKSDISHCDKNVIPCITGTSLDEAYKLSCKERVSFLRSAKVAEGDHSIKNYLDNFPRDIELAPVKDTSEFEVGSVIVWWQRGDSPLAMFKVRKVHRFGDFLEGTDGFQCFDIKLDITNGQATIEDEQGVKNIVGDQTATGEFQPEVPDQLKGLGYVDLKDLYKITTQNNIYDKSVKHGQWPLSGQWFEGAQHTAVFVSQEGPKMAPEDPDDPAHGAVWVDDTHEPL
eukprot:gnl/TRDRNA2_/TRDRNA2_174930_c0_seq2.p1 gnl/TRDRNA2_/TRDRNA2_174930_c0~~gnl/TRDRNA2_/TRDRNA2_174930_c0_seq2.p1  ORF type:complete len:1314 (+),score=261.47 gnl/TRDRNA2_/TRDRNA2_174930_c0_seq2:82-4023(+)